MKSRSYIGKTVSYEKLRDAEADIYPPEEFDDECTVAEIYLRDFEFDGFTDKTGRNAYSIQLYLDKEKIVKIIRIGHCHMCGGQGSDDELKRFPHETLETEAEEVLELFLI